MKKIDFKKVLAFIIVPLILTYFALDYLDYNAKTNSLIFFDALYIYFMWCMEFIYKKC